MTDQISELRATAVDMSGLMAVLSKNLYSTPNVAVRELVQNAHDSIVRRRLEDGGFSGVPGAVRVVGEPATQTLRIIDTGAGLTEEEIHKYLAMVGSSYTSKLRRENDSGELIGMFGLGFLSAFALSRRVTVHTTSFQQPDRGWRYRSATGESYSVEPCAARAVGSEIRLELRDEYKHLAESGVLAAVLTRYCALLGVPVYVNDSETPINATTPPWHEDRAENATVVALPAQLRRKRMAFAEAYEQRFHPICTIPVESDSVRGLL
ncbi:MAG: ATP-binding protein, partial [Gallionellaceae bacterium]|nr:ATP-binding protein [Gallionellaceae bacterium]